MDRAISGCLRLCTPASSSSSRFRSACNLALALIVGFCAWSTAAAAQEHWATYTNPRFGTTTDYPSDLFTVQDPPAENGDGQTFRTADGRAELSIYGTNNLESALGGPWSNRYRRQSQFSVVAGPLFGPISGSLESSGAVFGIGGFEPPQPSLIALFPLRSEIDPSCLQQRTGGWRPPRRAGRSSARPRPG